METYFLNLLSSEKIFSNFLSLLEYTDLANLSLVSKQLSIVLEPVIWADIELFPPAYHEETHTKGLPWHPARPNRPYRPLNRHHPSDETFGAYQQSATKWLIHLTHLEASRRIKLCAHRRSLRAPLSWNGAGLNEPIPWDIFQAFVNLKDLHLVMEHTCQSPALDLTTLHQPLRNLENVKLYGYVPIAFIEYILTSAPTLKSLDIGVLDDPISGAEFEKVRESSPLSDDVQQSHHNLDDLALFDDNVSPRPLDWIPKVLPDLPCLTHLHLCQPSEMDPAEFCWGRIHHSRSREEVCLQGWMRLIRHVSSTIQHLVLEQRPAANEYGLEGGSSEAFMRYYGQPSNQRLIDAIEILLEAVRFPALRRLDFAGVLVHEPLSAEEEVSKERLMAMCRERGWRCSLLLGRRCIFNAEDGVVYNEDGMGTDNF